jgi:hypothetical protein
MPLNAFGVSGIFIYSLLKASFNRSKIKMPLKLRLKGIVPGTGFEPAHGFPRCDLNTVRLPISPPGQGNRQIPVWFRGANISEFPDSQNPAFYQAFQHTVHELFTDIPVKTIAEPLTLNQ